MSFSELGKIVKDGSATDEIAYLYKAARLEGTYILGRPKSGKTGLLTSLIKKDIKQNIGLCVIDPHDLIDIIISQVPKEREKDILLLDMTRPTFGLNPLLCPDPTDEIAIQYTLSQILHIFEKSYGISRETALMYDYLYNCAYTLIVNPGCTLLDIRPLLTNEAYRRRLISRVTNESVKTFWDYYDELPKHDRLKEQRYILNKLNDISNAPLESILGGTLPTLDIRKVMDEGKILLVKLDVRLENPTSLLGSLIVAQILNVAYARKGERRQFHLYIDECQRFGATEDLSTLIAESRKFGVGLTLSHQYRKQLDESLRNATLMMGNLLIFSVNANDAEEMARTFKLEPRRELVWQPMRVPQYKITKKIVWEPETAEAEFQKIGNEKRLLLIQAANFSPLMQLLTVSENHSISYHLQFNPQIYLPLPPPDALREVQPIQNQKAIATREPGERFYALMEDILSPFEQQLHDFSIGCSDPGVKQLAADIFTRLHKKLLSDRENQLYSFIPQIKSWEQIKAEEEAAYNEEYDRINEINSRHVQNARIREDLMKIMFITPLVLLGVGAVWAFQAGFIFPGVVMALLALVGFQFTHGYPAEISAEKISMSYEEIYEIKRETWEQRSRLIHSCVHIDDIGYWRVKSYPGIAEWCTNELAIIQKQVNAIQAKAAEKQKKELELFKCRKEKEEKEYLGYDLEVDQSETISSGSSSNHSTRESPTRLHSEGDSAGRSAGFSMTTRFKKWVKEPGPEEPLSNTEKRIKDDILSLSYFTVKARIIIPTEEKDETGKPLYAVREYIVKTFKPDEGIRGKAFEERIQRILHNKEKTFYYPQKISTPHPVQERESEPMKTVKHGTPARSRSDIIDE